MHNGCAGLHFYKTGKRSIEALHYCKSDIKIGSIFVWCFTSLEFLNKQGILLERRRIDVVTRVFSQCEVSTVFAMLRAKCPEMQAMTKISDVANLLLTAFKDLKICP